MLNKYKPENDHSNQNYGFVIALGCMSSGIGQLPVSILRGTIESASVTIGFVSIVITISWLWLAKKNWTAKKLDSIKKVANFLVLFAISLGGISFIIRSVLDQQPNFFSFFLMIGYTIIVIITFLLLKMIYNNKKSYI